MLKYDLYRGWYFPSNGTTVTDVPWSKFSTVFFTLQFCLATLPVPTPVAERLYSTLRTSSLKTCRRSTINAQICKGFNRVPGWEHLLIRRKWQGLCVRRICRSRPKSLNFPHPVNILDNTSATVKKIIIISAKTVNFTEHVNSFGNLKTLCYNLW